MIVSFDFTVNTEKNISWCKYERLYYFNLTGLN